jgi:Protein of unknown function (DUF3987)
VSNTTTARIAAQQTQPKLNDFLAAFFPDAQEIIHLRAFKAKAAPDDEHNYPLSLTTTRGQLASDKAFQQKLRWLNETRGVYFVVNSGGNKDEEITRYNACFVENDSLPIAEQHALLDACPVQPNIRVETSKSVHAYWLLAGDCSEAEWCDVQRRLISFFDGDKLIKNPSRVMRLPYFQHLTYNELDGTITKKQVEIVEFSPECLYTVAEMQSAFPAVEVKQYTNSTAQMLDERHADLKQLLRERAKLNGRGIYEMACPAHNGKGETSLFFNPLTGAFKCLDGCRTVEVRRAFGLPEKPFASDSSSSCNSYFVQPKLDRGRALYGLAGEIVRAIEPHSEADPVSLLLQTLVAFGNIIGRTAYFEADGADHHLNLYGVLVGATSAGKGSSWSHVKRLFASVESEWMMKRVKSGLSSGEGLIFDVRDDTSIEDKRLLIVESEFASVLQMNRRDGNILSPVMRGLWDDGTAHTLTKNSPLSATNAHVSIIGHITPDELTRCIDATQISNGYANRILWAYVRRSKQLPNGGKLSAGESNYLAQSLFKAVEYARVVKEMHRDDEAERLWTRIYPKLTEERAGAFGKVTARGRAQVVRLSCLYALLERSAAVKRVHLEAALALWQYCEESARLIFGDSTGNKEADKLLRALQEAPEQKLRKTDVTKGVFGGNTEADKINAAFAILQRLGLADSFTEGEGKHKTEWWFARNCTKYEMDESNEMDEADERLERAAILEYDGGLPRVEAERQAGLSL